MTPATPGALVLSAHLDDAVLSCPGWILERAKAGDQPLVVTVFSETQVRDDDESVRRHRQRQHGDETGVRLLGATRRLGGFAVAAQRHPAYASFAGETCNRVYEDESTFAKVTEYLRELLHETAPRWVLAPLGVGQHVDHRLLHDVAAGLSEEHPKTQFAYYEDRPYCFVDESVRARLGQLGRVARTNDFADRSPALRAERFFMSFFAAPYARQHLHMAEQARVVTHMLQVFVRVLQEPGLPAHSSMRTWERDVLEEIMPAFDAFASQHSGFMGSPLYHQWIALEYARRLGQEGKYAERYWHL